MNCHLVKAKSYFLSLIIIFGSIFSFSPIFSQTTLFYSDFENSTSTFAANGWNVVNPGTNDWFVGTKVSYGGNKGAYISQNGGSSNNYKKNTWQNAHFYRDVVIPASATGITLSFTYKGIGEKDWDKLLVYTAPTTVTPTTSYPVMWGENLPGANLIFRQNDEESSWVTESVTLSNSLAGTTVRLIFTWQNDDNQGSNPAAAIDNISLTYCDPPTVTGTSTYTCVGGSTGTITASASGGSTPYTYSLDGTTYQLSATFTGLAAGAYTLYVKNKYGCVGSVPVSVSAFPNSPGDQYTSGTDSWIGHLYKGMNFNNYIGYFTEPELFDEGFGGDYNCFSVTSSFGTSSVYTEQYSVRFRMNSTRSGFYIIDLGSDDGSRLTVDGNTIYNNWTDQSFSTRSRVLVPLTGSSSLVYEFYENGGLNRVIFNNGVRLLANELTSNTTQNICIGSLGSVISGDTFGSLPSGISLSGTGYQWSYSITPGGARTDISGATSATFTPNTSAAPFNVSGTYYVYRSAKLLSANNTGVSPYVAVHVSNAATITINAIPSATISYTGSPFCNTSSIAEAVTISGTGGGSFTATPSGLSINASSGAIVPSASIVGAYTVTYTFTSPGCAVYTSSANVKIGVPGTWTGKVDNDWGNASNWICGLIPNLSTDALLPTGASHYPAIISGLHAVKNITLQTNAFLTVTGTLQIAGNITANAGAIKAAIGTVEMKGSSGQSISGSSFDKRKIKNLVVSNTGSGLSVSSAANDTLNISGTLSFGSPGSTLNTGDNITLVSDSNGTACVGMVGAGNTINGKVIVERYINTGIIGGQHGKSWQFLAIPTQGQTIKQSWMENGNSISTGYGTEITGAGGIAAGFDLPTAFPSIKYYDPLTNNWVGVSNTSVPIYNPKGYLVFVRGDRSVTYNQPSNTTTLRTKGTLFTGSLSPISVIPDKWESVGNPYAAPVNFTLITKGPAIDDLFYVWDPYLYGSYGLGGYQTLSSINNWEPVPGGTVVYKTGVPHKTIESGQAFYVHATSFPGANPSSYTLTFTENSKVVSGSSLNFARYQNVQDERKQLFRTSLYTGTDSSSMIADGNVVAFGENFDNGVDGNDAFKINNSGENFGLRRNGKLLSIEAKQPVKDVDTIYFQMNNLRQQTYQLRFTPQNMENSRLEAFLNDQFLNTTTPVSLTEETKIDIKVTDDKSSSASDRFKIVFKRIAPVLAEFVSANAYEKEKDIVVEWSVRNESDMAEYQVEKSGDGREFVHSTTIPAINGETENYQWKDQQALTGYNYYRIHGIGKDGKSIYTRVMNVLKGKVNAGIVVYPNPVTGGNINLLLTNQPAGNYGIRLLNSLGQVIATRAIVHTGGNRMEKIAVSQNISKELYQLEITGPDGRTEVIKLIK